MFSQGGQQPFYSLEYEKLRASDLMLYCVLCKETPDIVLQLLRGNFQGNPSVGNFQGSPSVGNLLRGAFLEEVSNSNLLREVSKGIF